MPTVTQKRFSEPATTLLVLSPSLTVKVKYEVTDGDRGDGRHIPPTFADIEIKDVLLLNPERSIMAAIRYFDPDSDKLEKIIASMEGIDL